MNAQEYASKAGNIFVLPDAVIKVKQLIDDQAATMDEIADVINYDPGIMSQLLKIANSALYKFPSKITTVSKAMQVIGTNSVYDLVLAYGVSNSFRDIDSKIIDLEGFWENSVGCGLTAKYLAEENNLKQAEKLFVCGLLHNIGELVMVMLDPEKAKQCSAVTSTMRPVDLQMKYLGFTYAEISTGLLTLWGLPSDITQVIGALHGSQKNSKSIEEQILSLSSVLSVNNTYREHYDVMNQVHLADFPDLLIDKQDIQDTMDFTNLQLLSTLALFNPSSFSLY